MQKIVMVTIRDLMWTALIVVGILLVFQPDVTTLDPTVGGLTMTAILLLVTLIGWAADDPDLEAAP